VVTEDDLDAALATIVEVLGEQGNGSTP